MAEVKIPDSKLMKNTRTYVTTGSDDIYIYYDGDGSQKTGRYISAGQTIMVYTDTETSNGYVFLTTKLGWVSLIDGNLMGKDIIDSHIETVNYTLKVTRDEVQVHSSPGEGYSVTRTLNTGDNFKCTQKYVNPDSGATWYRIEDSEEWVYSLYLTKTNTIDLKSDSLGVSKPATIESGVKKFDSTMLVLCGYTQNLRTYPSMESGTALKGSVTNGQQYIVSYLCDSSDGTWYYLADGSGWFCATYGENEISTIITACNEEGKIDNMYLVTADTLNFRSDHDGSKEDNILGKFYKGDKITILDTYTKKYGDEVIEEWVKTTGKNNKGETVTGWVCINYKGTSNVSNDAMALNTPSDLYVANEQITTYAEPGGTVVGTILKGDDLTLTGESKVIKVKDEKGKETEVTYLKTASGTWIVANKDAYTQYTQETYIAKLQAMQNRADAEALVALNEDIVDFTDFETSMGKLRVKDTYAVLGSPYQFNRLADYRIDEDNYKFGRVYADKIVTKFPMLILMPGIPTFMGDASTEEQKKGLLETIKSAYTVEKMTDDFLGKETRFYTLSQAFDDYFNYVNPLCRAGAFFLGIEDTKISFGKENSPLKSFNWQNIYTEGVFQEVFSGMANCVSFFVSSEVTVSDSWSNSTAEPSFASNMDSISEQAREINYLIGNVNASAGGTFDDVLKEFGLSEEVNISNLEENINSIINGSFLKNTSVGGILKTASKQASGLIQGAKMIFPELWSDSSYGSEHSVTMKFMTPDGDKLSWFMNCWVPMCFLIALVAPRTLTSMHMYHSPFIVNANYKSQFSCPMGIITSLTFSKGQEGAWTIDGLPTVVEVSLSIKELYTSFAITSAMADSKDLGITKTTLGGLVTNAFMNNNLLMDYIANSCGININEPDLERDFKMWKSFQITNKIEDTIDNVFGRLRSFFTAKAVNILNGIFKKV